MGDEELRRRNRGGVVEGVGVAVGVADVESSSMYFLKPIGCS